MYKVIVTGRAERALAKVDAGTRRRIIMAIEHLAADPQKKADVKKLIGSEFYRLRVSDWRVIFDRNVREKLIRVITIGHRKEVYR